MNDSVIVALIILFALWGIIGFVVGLNTETSFWDGITNRYKKCLFVFLTGPLCWMALALVYGIDYCAGVVADWIENAKAWFQKP